MNEKMRATEVGNEQGKGHEETQKPRGGVISALLVLLAAGIISAGIFYPWTTSMIKFPGQYTTKDISEGTKDVYFKVQDAQAAQSSAVVWDWGDEDGDIVKVAGVEIPILHNPQGIPVTPTAGTAVEVLGVKDGYGGITVGISAPGCTPAIRIMHIKPGQIGHIYFK